MVILSEKTHMGNIEMDKIKIEYLGDTRTIGYMKEYLETNHAEYWFWDTLVSKFIVCYRKFRDENDIGILLPEFPIVNGISIFDIKGKMSVGSYDKKRLFKIIDMYEILLNIEEEY